MIVLSVNGRSFSVEDASTNKSLLDWLRDEGLTGSKQGCSEGDCGACSVALIERDVHGAPTYRAINACIALLPMFAGREVVTVEGLAGSTDLSALQKVLGERTCFTDPDHLPLHPVQQAMVRNYGSQCGYCTPGFVVSMFEAYERERAGETLTQPQLLDQLCGNLCRCTGYRPIRDAMVEALEVGQLVGADALTRRLRADVHIPPMEHEANGQRFVRPDSLESLLGELADPGAILVGGATEIGVEINKKFKEFPKLVSTEGVLAMRVVERRAILEDDGSDDDDGRMVDGWWVGGAVTLTDLEQALDGSIAPLQKMLTVFASRQIRSRATLAGNLVTASPIGDMAPVLLALDATVELSSRSPDGPVLRRVPLVEFFVGYRKTVLRTGEVMVGIFVPDAPEDVARHAESYKVSKRRELDISITAACFCIDVREGVVTAARLAYGGVAATPMRAREAEAVIVGLPWPLSAEARLAVQTALTTTFTPLDDARSGEAYRRGLVVELFEKFCAGDRSESQDEPLGFVRGTESVALEASKALRHESAVGHVTGHALYVDDMAHKRGPTLEMWPVMSPHARARIVRRDATAARRMPGVHAILFAEDIPGINDVGAVRKDEPLLADGEVYFHGQMVAIVYADSYELARKAAFVVEVEYEPLPALLDIEAAIAANSYHTEPHRIRRGDAKAALKASQHRLAGTFKLGGQEHFYLETHAAYAERGDEGDITVVSSTQHPSEIQVVIAHLLHIHRNKVTVQSPRMGGGFGGKETQGNTWSGLAALGAWKTQRPVRVQLDRDLDMVLTGKRHGFRASFEVGFDDDGRLRGLVVELVSDGGWALDLSESILDRALFHVDNGYYIPTVDLLGRVAKTHTVSNTAFRGFGSPQGMLVTEEIMDRVARTLGLRPEVVRERNLYRGAGETNTTHYGQPIGDNRLQQMWVSLKKTAELDARRREIDAHNLEHAQVKRGIAMTPVKFGISFTASFLNQAGALVLFYTDGTCQVNHGGTEMGQGLYTKLAGVAMRELGLTAEQVRVMKTQTDKVPNTSATAASAGADLNGMAVKNACEQLRLRLWIIAAKLLGEQGVTTDALSLRAENGEIWSPSNPLVRVKHHQVCTRAHFEQVSMSAVGYYRTPGIQYDKARGQGRPFHYFACGVAITEVEVDGRSGMKRVRRVDVLHDVGDSLNPAIDRGQVEGAYVQGLGWLTGEELLWDDKGKLLTHSASTYQIPSISDAPFDFRVTLLPDAAQQNTIHGSKAVGEPPLMLAISAREAIRDAVAAFSPKARPIPLASPATHEAIFAAVRAVRA